MRKKTIKHPQQTINGESMKRRAKKQGNILIAMGVTLILAALILVGYNYMGDRTAGAEATSVLGGIRALIDAGHDNYEENLEEIPDYIRNPEMELPRAKIGDHECVGIIQIPTIEIELPVIADYEDNEIMVGPCRFFGSPYTNNMVICAHNYDSHFRKIGNLKEGDSVVFMDLDGNVFNYKVAKTEALKATDVAEMCDSEWDLSLFTCTFGAKYRVTVRCVAEDDGK